MFINFLIGIFVFVFGLCIGSFLNCVVYRLEKKEKLAGRSYCPQCKNTLSWRDLFPVFSFLCLWGKCKYCKTKISWQYPIVEVATGVMFLLIFNFSAQGGLASGWNFLNLAFLFYVAAVLIVIFVYDFKYYIIPDKVLFPAIAITFAYRLFEGLLISNFTLVGTYLLAILIGSGFFLFIFLISKGRWMGFGDVKLAILMGLLLGFPNILVALFLAFFLGAVIGTIMMIFKEKNLRSELPFAPFLITGTFVALLWGARLVEWYVNLFLL